MRKKKKARVEKLNDSKEYLNVSVKLLRLRKNMGFFSVDIF